MDWPQSARVDLESLASTTYARSLAFQPALVTRVCFGDRGRASRAAGLDERNATSAITGAAADAAIAFLKSDCLDGPGADHPYGDRALVRVGRGRRRG